MMMKRWNEKKKKKNIIKEEDLLDFLHQIPRKKKFYLIYIWDIEELFQDLKEEGDISYL